ncbi:hypothetical protein ACGFRB_32460 [Streptomyces sp. NPDC048718]|uniref:hypothetical protein n=1 Tax=Streptomyces sp. NPDC048718 TaxID=3365587 RepID=UPI00371B418E
MTTAETWHATDRLLPLGDAADGAWIAERTVRALLAQAARRVRGVVAGRPGFRLAGEGARSPVPVPPGGLPPGELRISMDVAAVAGRPLPQLTGRLRAALLDAAEGTLGLKVAGVDLRVTELLDTPPDRPAPPPPPGRTSPPAPDDPAALTTLTVPGVAALTDAFGAPLQRTPGHVRVEVAVTTGYRALTVARAISRALTTEEQPKVTVLISELH